MATTRLRKHRADKGGKQASRKIDAEDAIAILEEATEKAEVKREEGFKREPGMTFDGAKIPWTKKDIEERFPIVELLAEETVPIIWNGVTYQLIQGATHYVPNVIRDSYLRHRGEMRKAGKNLGEGSGFNAIVNLGAGALEEE